MRLMCHGDLMDLFMSNPGSGEIRAAGSVRQRGMVLPFAPLSITFDDIRYSVDMPQVPYFS